MILFYAYLTTVGYTSVVNAMMAAQAAETPNLAARAKPLIKLFCKSLSTSETKIGWLWRYFD